MFAGIPYQDPTPELQSRWDFHKSVAGILYISGSIVFLLGITAMPIIWIRMRKGIFQPMSLADSSNMDNLEVGGDEHDHGRVGQEGGRRAQMKRWWRGALLMMLASPLLSFYSSFLLKEIFGLRLGDNPGDLRNGLTLLTFVWAILLGLLVFRNDLETQRSRIRVLLMAIAIGAVAFFAFTALMLWGLSQMTLV